MPGGLYNTMFGVETTAKAALVVLRHHCKLDFETIPRFRDAYFTWADEAETDPVIVIHTRAGGGNRRGFAEQIEKLQGITGYRHDRDCKHDTTYADFTFDVPEEFRPTVIGWLKKNGKPLSAEEKFAELMDMLRNGV